jgi:WD40 repeat protein
VLATAIMITNASFLFIILRSVPMMEGFQMLPNRQCMFPKGMTVLSSNENDDDINDNEMIFFDDFSEYKDLGFLSDVGEKNDSALNQDVTSDPFISNVIQKAKHLEGERMKRIAQNFSTGNWSCRGFSLDQSRPVRFDTNDNESTNDDEIYITQIAFDETATGPGFGHSTETIAVSRSDGTVFLIHIGTDYLTKFIPTSNIKMTTNPDGQSSTVSITSQMSNEREYAAKQKNLMLGKGGEISENMRDDSDPFEIVAQFQAGKEKIDALLFHDDYVYTASGCIIQVWKIGNVMDIVSDSESDIEMIPMHHLKGHDGTIVGLKTVSSEGKSDICDFNVLVSASSDGSFALWDRIGGDMIYRCTMLDESGNPTSITSFDVDTSSFFVDDHIIYLGLASGHVVAYSVSDLVQNASKGDACPIPKCRFLAHDGNKVFEGNLRGVTAISCGGPGRRELGATSGSSSVLITGGADGVMKQWEIFHANDGGKLVMNHWPRIPTQKMKDRAHIFNIDRGPITNIVCDLDVQKGPMILAASAEGYVGYFNPGKERALFFMDGFIRLTSICLDREILVTNGMGQYVCVHDFDVDEIDVDESIDIDNF